MRLALRIFDEAQPHKRSPPPKVGWIAPHAPPPNSTSGAAGGGSTPPPQSHTSIEVKDCWVDKRWCELEGITQDSRGAFRTSKSNSAVRGGQSQNYVKKNQKNIAFAWLHRQRRVPSDEWGMHAGVVPPSPLDHHCAHPSIQERPMAEGRLAGSSGGILTNAVVGAGMCVPFSHGPRHLGAEGGRLRGGGAGGGHRHRQRPRLPRPLLRPHGRLVLLWGRGRGGRSSFEGSK